jgi:hypothetical protein
VAGYIKLYRSVLSWEWFDDANTLKMFVYLLLNARHDEGRWQGKEVHAGQLITGRMALAKNLKMSERSVRTCLERLKSTNEVTIKTTNKYSIITVVNWGKYQVYEDANDQQNDQPADQQATSKRPASDQQTTTNKKGKNVKNGEKNKNTSYSSSEPQAASKEQPSEMTPDGIFSLPLVDGSLYPITRQQIDEWKSLYPAVDVEQEIRKMIGWLNASPDRRKTHKGILRFVNGWLSKTQDRGGTNGYQQSMFRAEENAQKPERRAY